MGINRDGSKNSLDVDRFQEHILPGHLGNESRENTRGSCFITILDTGSRS